MDKREQNWFDREKMNYAALQIVQAGGWDCVTGDEEPRCVGCGCDDPELLVPNHKNGGGMREWRTAGRSGDLRRAIFYEKRGVKDLDLRCPACHAVYDWGRKYPGKRMPQVKWVEFDIYAADEAEGGEVLWGMTVVLIALGVTGIVALALHYLAGWPWP